jgi:glutamate synthase domain-containing protein 1
LRGAIKKELREGNVRIPSGCAISGIFSKIGKRFNGNDIIKSIATMHDRSNGLGGGFAAYGIYPEYRELFALHIFYDDFRAKENAEAFIKEWFDIEDMSEIATRKTPLITDEPIIWRYFVKPAAARMKESGLDEMDYAARHIIHVNSEIQGAYVFSSGKNMGAFKAVGFPEDVGDFYKLEEYEGHCWIAHGRYPTNTPGWWGGAHPFAMLNCAVVHNGEISSYDANRRYIEMFGYKCDLLTDTEVITYIIDYLHRKLGLSLEETAAVMAAPFWSEIDRMPEEKKRKFTYLRNAFSSLLVTGPFSILVGFENGMMALGDRLKLRSMVVAEKGDLFYAASEECAIRVIEPDIEGVWAPGAGEAVIVMSNGGNV